MALRAIDTLRKVRPEGPLSRAPTCLADCYLGSSSQLFQRHSNSTCPMLSHHNQLPSSPVLSSVNTSITCSVAQE